MRPSPSCPRQPPASRHPPSRLLSEPSRGPPNFKRKPRAGTGREAPEGRAKRKTRVRELSGAIRLHVRSAKICCTTDLVCLSPCSWFNLSWQAFSLSWLAFTSLPFFLVLFLRFWFGAFFRRLPHIGEHPNAAGRYRSDNTFQKGRGIQSGHFGKWLSDAHRQHSVHIFGRRI